MSWTALYCSSRILGHPIRCRCQPLGVYRLYRKVMAWSPLWWSSLSWWPPAIFNHRASNLKVLSIGNDRDKSMFGLRLISMNSAQVFKCFILQQTNPDVVCVSRRSRFSAQCTRTSPSRLTLTLGVSAQFANILSLRKVSLCCPKHLDTPSTGEPSSWSSSGGSASPSSGYFLSRRVQEQVHSHH